MQTFQVGQRYTTRSACDRDCVFGLVVASRTAKTIKTTSGKTLRISIYDGAEVVWPQGKYSMAPIIRANA